MKFLKRVIKEHILLIIILAFIFIVAILPKKSGMASNIKRNERIDNPHLVRKDNDLLKIAVDNVDKALNPFFESSKETGLFTKLIHSSLYKTNKNGELEPDLAQDIWYEDQARKLHIVLKKGLKFPSGKEITSQDIINNILILSDPDYDGQKSYYVEGIGGYFQYKKRGAKDLLKVYKENDYYLTVDFSKASRDNLKLLQMPIIPVDDKMIRYGDLNSIRHTRYNYGAGNYHFLSSLDKGFIFEKNDVNKNIIEKIYIEFMPYYQAKSMYQRGLVDILYKYVTDEAYEDNFIDGRDDFTYFLNNQTDNYIKLGFNLRDGFFSEDKLRLALKDSVDFVSIFQIKKENQISSPIYKNLRYYKDEVSDDNPLNLGDLTEDIEDKNVSLAIYNGLTNIIEKEALLKKEFDKYNLKLEISHINEDQVYEIISGHNQYDMFIIEDQLFTIPTVDNQAIYDRQGDISDNSLDDFNNINRVEWLSETLHYDDYEEVMDWWQDWYYERIPYIPIKSEVEFTAVNKRFEGLLINEFVGLEDENNLKILNNLLK